MKRIIGLRCSKHNVGCLGLSKLYPDMWGRTVFSRLIGLDISGESLSLVMKINVKPYFIGER